MDKYSLPLKIFLYLSIAVFFIFILLPFVEMFYASLRPLKHIFRSPYQFYSDDLSFWAYREMWNTVPLLGRYIFNSFFMAVTVTFFTLLFVVPAAYSYARFNFPFKQGSLWVLLAVTIGITPWEWEELLSSRAPGSRTHSSWNQWCDLACRTSRERAG